jgi:hypothetical protein
MVALRASAVLRIRSMFYGVDFYPHGTKLPMMKLRRYCIAVSWGAATTALALIVTNGLNRRPLPRPNRTVLGMSSPESAPPSLKKSIKRRSKIDWNLCVPIPIITHSNENGGK